MYIGFITSDWLATMLSTLCTLVMYVYWYVSSASASNTSCPTWFYYKNTTNQCEYGSWLGGWVHCNQMKKTTQNASGLFLLLELTPIALFFSLNITVGPHYRVTCMYTWIHSFTYISSTTNDRYHIHKIMSSTQSPWPLYVLDTSPLSLFTPTTLPIIVHINIHLWVHAQAWGRGGGILLYTLCRVAPFNSVTALTSSDQTHLHHEPKCWKTLYAASVSIFTGGKLIQGGCCLIK